MRDTRLGFLGAVGLAVVSSGIAILLVDTDSLSSWIAAALIGVGLTSIALIGIFWLILAARREGSPPRHKEPRLPPDAPTPPADPIAPTASAIAFWVGRPNTHGDRFFGRQADLDALASAFVDSRVVVVSGGAGVGKSQLAAEFSHRAGCDGFWTTAGDSTTQTLAGLAQHLGVEERNRTPDEIGDNVGRRLTTLPPETLWIVDNLADIAQVNALAGSTGQVKLLATTRDDRRQLLAGTSKFLRLAVIEEQGAIDLLCSRSRTDSNDIHLKEIAQVVGNLPLALEMLAGRPGEYGQTPAGILEQLNSAPTTIEWERFQETEGSSIDNAEGVFTTIAGTLATLPGDVRARLSPLGYIADAPVPHNLLKALVELDDEGARKLVEECRRRSIISIVEGRATVHALTVAAIAATNPEGSLETPLARGGTRLDSINRDDPRALREELNHYEQLLLQSQKALGEEHRSPLSLATSVAIGYGTVGRHEAAIELDEHILGILERLMGPEHPDTLAIRGNVASDYGAIGRYNEAIELDEVSLGVRERVQGAEHPDTLVSRNNLAVCYREVGRNDEAIKLDEGTLRLMDRVLGAEHPRTLTSRNNLALCYREVGRLDEAIKLDEGTRQARERVLGAEHPDTRSTRHNLAICYRKAGMSREADELEANGT